MLVMLDPTAGHIGFHAGSTRSQAGIRELCWIIADPIWDQLHPPGARSTWEVPWVAVWGRGAPEDPPRAPPFHDTHLR